MSIEIRPTESLDEFQSAIGSIGHYFGGWPDREGAERFARTLPFDRMHAAFDEGAVIGGAGAFPFRLTVPGGELDCAGVTVVGVLPTHRRRGVLTSLMHEQLDDVRRRGEPLAALWASEAAIYRRYGYGLASLGATIDLPKRYTALRPEPEPGMRVRLVSLEDAQPLVQPVYDRVQRLTPGMFSRTDAWWETRQLADPVDRREDGAQKNVAVLERDGVPAAYALYRVVSKFEGGSNVGYVRVIEAIGDDGAEVELWRFLLGIDWIASYRSMIATDHPLLHALVYPGRLRQRLGDALWLRLVDVATALSGRSYGADDPLVLDVADQFLPENAGRWRLAGGRAERTEDEPDLSLDVGELGSLYLGAFTASELVRSGLVRELRESAASRADAVFRSERKPWCPEIF